VCSFHRKNPVHFKEYSHTDKDSKADDDDDGDDDDDDEALGDGSDDRPECPYGTSCYRKNPQHKRDFKRNKAPGRRLLLCYSSSKPGVADFISDHFFPTCTLTFN